MSPTARAIRSIGPAALLLLMSALYWPVLRTIAPGVAVDAGFARSVSPTTQMFTLLTVRVGQHEHAVDLDLPNPWGGGWSWRDGAYYCERSSVVASGAPDGVKVDQERATTALFTLLAMGSELFVLLAGFAGACALQVLVRDARRVGAIAVLAGAALATCAAIPAVEFVRVRPWLVGEIPAWRVHGTVGLTALMIVLAVRLNLWARTVDSAALVPSTTEPA